MNAHGAWQGGNGDANLHVVAVVLAGAGAAAAQRLARQTTDRVGVVVGADDARHVDAVQLALPARALCSGARHSRTESAVRLENSQGGVQVAAHEVVMFVSTADTCQA
jgi:hypothetical protein